MNVQTHFAYVTAHLYSLRAGLSYEDSEDAALAFLVSELEKAGGLEELDMRCRDSPALIRKCARDHVLDAVRCEYRRRGHMFDWPQIEERDGETRAWDAPEHPHDLDGTMLRHAFWDIMLPFLQALAPGPREFFLRHHVGGEPMRDIALACGKTTHAVEQSVYRSREKLRTALESRGQSYDVLRQLVSPWNRPSRFAGLKSPNNFLKIARMVREARRSSDGI